jgi:hypothetical protein
MSPTEYPWFSSKLGSLVCTLPSSSHSLTVECKWDRWKLTVMFTSVDSSWKVFSILADTVLTVTFIAYHWMSLACVDRMPLQWQHVCHNLPLESQQINHESRWTCLTHEVWLLGFENEPWWHHLFWKRAKNNPFIKLSFHLMFVPSVNPILNKQQAHDYFMAHLFFDPPQSPLFCPQNLNILRTKLRASPHEILHSCQIQRIFICEDFEFLLTDWMHYNWTFSKKDSRT